MKKSISQSALSLLMPDARWLWREGWANLPVPDRGIRNQRTYGVTVLRDGRIVTQLRCE